MKINGLVKQLCQLYGTNAPFELASALNIAVLMEDLGTINGYYNKQLRMKQIHINQNLPEHEQKFTCAHELGHALLHPNANTPFLRANTFLSVDKLEIEANKFAVDLLISDDIIEECANLTLEQLSMFFGYHQKLIALRMRKTIF